MASSSRSCTRPPRWTHADQASRRTRRPNGDHANLPAGNRWQLAGRAWHSAPVPEIHFDERIAAVYDVGGTVEFDPAVIDSTVSFLADLARDGAALELGIGTGRIALPLSRRGVR